MNGVSVVIPNYNGVALFPHTLPTVFEALSFLELPWELIISDDASTDDSLNWIRTHYPDVVVVESPVNHGFSVTANRGVQAARYELVLLLNSDVKLTPGYFAPLLPHFEDPALFGVQGRIVGWNDDIVQEGAKYPYFHGVKIKTSGNYLLADEEAMRGGLATMYLSGANALVRRSVYLGIGGLNELFSPFYVEDYELSLRAWRLGYRCRYEHFAVCRHKTSSTIRTPERRRQVAIVYNRNKMFLHALHLGRGQRYLYFLQLIPETLLRVVTGNLTFLRSLGQFVKHYPQLRRSRATFLQKAEGTPLASVREVANNILETIKNKKINQF